MSDPLKPLKSGDSLPTSARTWNPVLDAARAHQARGLDQGAEGPSWSRSATIIRIKNNTGEDLPRFAVVGLSGPIFRPGEEPTPFLQEVAFKGVVPGSSHGGRFAVLLAPARKGEVTRGYVSGVCPVRIAAEDDEATSAGLEPGETGHLTPGGPAEVLWIDSEAIPPPEPEEPEEPEGPEEDPEEPELRWAIIRLGGGSGGLIRVQIPQGTIAHGASAMVKLYKADHTLGTDELKAFNRSGKSIGSADEARTGYIDWIGREGEWQVVQEVC